MRISHRHKFVFIAIPRTASFSMREALDPFTDIKGSAFDPYYTHIKAFQLKRIFEQNGWDWNQYFKFTFVRNPWERMYSQFRLYTQRDWAVPVPVYRDFKEWCLHSEQDIQSAVKGIPVRWRQLLSIGDRRKTVHYSVRHLECLWDQQCEWIYDADGNQLVDFIGRFENLNQDQRRIFQTLGLNGSALKHLDLAAGSKLPALKDCRLMYDDETYGQISRKFSKDIELFGY